MAQTKRPGPINGFGVVIVLAAVFFLLLGGVNYIWFSGHRLWLGGILYLARVITFSGLIGTLGILMALRGVK